MPEDTCQAAETTPQADGIDGIGPPARLRFPVRDVGEVSALFLRPPDARWLMVLAHGAGAGMAHPFLEKLAGELAAVGVATFRYQFPYMERKARAPDPPKVLTATVAAAIQAARETAPDLGVLAGGKSMGGRMTSTAAAEHPLEGVRGIVFFGFPLHPPGRPGSTRAAHLSRVTVPMLFLQGTRDQFAEPELLQPVLDGLGSLATLHIIDTADHSFHVLKRSGTTDAAVLGELAHTVVGWASDQCVSSRVTFP